jgi:hypothetical protein
LGAVALVLVLGTGVYFAYKNGIFASTSTTNQCTIKLASLNRTPNSFAVYILDKQNYNKIQQNPSATGVGTLANFSTVGDSYTLTGPDPVYFVGHKQNGELIFSTPFTCNQNQNVAVNADLSGGSITWTSASTSQGQGGTGGQSYIVNNQLCIQEANGEYQVYNLNGRAWTSASGSSISYDDGLSRGAPMSKCTSQSNGAGGATSGTSQQTVCAKKLWVTDKNEYEWVTKDLIGADYQQVDNSYCSPSSTSGAPSSATTDTICVKKIGNGTTPDSYFFMKRSDFISQYGPTGNADFVIESDTSKCQIVKSSNTATTAQTGSTQCVKWKGTEVQLTKKDNLWMPVDSKNAPAGLERGLSDTELNLAQSSSEGRCAAAAASTTATTQKVAPINPELRVPTIGANSGFPVGRSSITLRAARYSYAGSPQYQGQNIAPVGGVSFTINITTTYTPQIQTGKSSFPNNIPIAYAQTNSTSSTSGNSNPTSSTAGNSNSTSNTSGGVNPNTSGGGFTYKSGWAQTAIDEAKDAIKRFGRAYGVSTSGTIPDNGINSQIVVTNLPPGDYSITLSKNGYKNTTIQFQVQDGEQKTVSPVMMAPNAGAEPPSINSNAIMMEANKEGVFWANTTSGKYLYNAQSPWWGWQFPESYNTQQPYYDANGMPHSTNPYYSPVWGQNYQAYMNSCQNISLAVGPGIDPTKAGLAATVFGLLKPHTGKTFLEDSLLPGLGTYFAAGAIQNSGASISVSKINQNCFSPQQTQYTNSQGILPSVMSLLHLPF